MTVKMAMLPTNLIHNLVIGWGAFRLIAELCGLSINDEFGEYYEYLSKLEKSYR